MMGKILDWMWDTERPALSAFGFTLFLMVVLGGLAVGSIVFLLVMTIIAYVVDNFSPWVVIPSIPVVIFIVVYVLNLCMFGRRR